MNIKYQSSLMQLTTHRYTEIITLFNNIINQTWRLTLKLTKWIITLNYRYKLDPLLFNIIYDIIHPGYINHNIIKENIIQS